MIERLGQVLYWGFTGLGVIIVLGAGILWYDLKPPYGFTWDMYILPIIAGGICWLIGRACLYVLSGR
jgi:hypothetical protein